MNVQGNKTLVSITLRDKVPRPSILCASREAKYQATDQSRYKSLLHMVLLQVSVRSIQFDPCTDRSIVHVRSTNLLDVSEVLDWTFSVVNAHLTVFSVSVSLTSVVAISTITPPPFMFLGRASSTLSN